jgi:predicted alpha/beta-hydrolase family hydrolase
MNLDNITYKFYHKQSSDRVYVVLHGSGTEGVESPFIAKVIEALTNTGNSVFGFNFPYCERGDESSSGPELTEEVEALKQVVEQLQGSGYKVTIVAKSLGAIVASFYLEQKPSDDIELIVLGYVIGDVKTQAVSDNLKAVIQGENDRFGGVEAVKAELGDISASVIEIPSADHSYRNDQKEPVFQDAAIQELLKLC